MFKHPQLDRSLHFETIDSTNLEAIRHRESARGQNVLYVADEQTQGQGQHGRSWESKAHKGLWASLFLSRPESLRYDLGLLSLYTGVIIRESLFDMCKLQVELKWPNDIMVGEKKCGGILSEVQWTGSEAKSVMLGFGINLRQHQTDFSPQIRRFSTSLLLEGVELDRDQLLEDITIRFFDQIKILNDSELLVKKWNAYGWKLYQELQWQHGEATVTGIFMGVNLGGHALIRVGSTIQTFASGEIRWMT